MITKFKRGNGAESLVISYLTNRGFVFVGRNIKTHWGEIDAILYKNGYWYIIEVKASFTQEPANPFIRIHKQKISHIVQSAFAYAHKHDISEEQLEYLYVFAQVKHDIVTLTFHDEF